MELASVPARLKPTIGIKQISWFDDRYYRVVLHDGNLVYIPSVTTYLNALPKPYLSRWRGDVGNQEADRRMYEAGEKGSRVHHACYVYATGGGVIYNPPSHLGMKDLNAQADSLIQQFAKAGIPYVIISSQEEAMMVYRFRRLMEILTPDILGAEVTLYSLSLNAAGMADYVLKIKSGTYTGISGAKPVILDEGIYLLDLKTGAQDNDHFVQLAAYTRLYEESTGVKVAGVLLTYLNSDTKTGIPGLNVKSRAPHEIDGDFEIFKAAQVVWRAKYGSQTPEVFDFPVLFYRSELPNPVPNDFVMSNMASPIKEVPERVDYLAEEKTPEPVKPVEKKKKAAPAVGEQLVMGGTGEKK